MARHSWWGCMHSFVMTRAVVSAICASWQDCLEQPLKSKARDLQKNARITVKSAFITAVVAVNWRVYLSCHELCKRLYMYLWFALRMLKSRCVAKNTNLVVTNYVGYLSHTCVRGDSWIKLNLCMFASPECKYIRAYVRESWIYKKMWFWCLIIMYLGYT